MDKLELTILKMCKPEIKVQGEPPSLMGAESKPSAMFYADERQAPDEGAVQRRRLVSQPDPSSVRVNTKGIPMGNDNGVTAQRTALSLAAASRSREVEELARELWWPHHRSRTRHIALAELDSGDVGEVSMEYADVVAIVTAAIEARLERDAAALAGGSKHEPR